MNTSPAARPSMVRSLIGISGWVCGLATTAIADYYLIPEVGAWRLGKLLAVGLGLALGTLVMYLFVEVAAAVAAKLSGRASAAPASEASEKKRPRSRLDDMSFGTRATLIGLTFFVALSVVFYGYPVGLIRQLFE